VGVVVFDHFFFKVDKSEFKVTHTVKPNRQSPIMHGDKAQFWIATAATVELTEMVTVGNIQLTTLGTPLHNAKHPMLKGAKAPFLFA
jgi:hypothetical protein